MKVICVGFWKTGTKSMSKALKVLGYENVYDYEEQYLYLSNLWEKFFDGSVKDSDIHEALKDIDVLIDGPTILFWSEIYRVFPNSKIVFTVRDEDGWWKSFKHMQDRMFEFSFFRFAIVLSPTAIRLGRYANKAFGYAFGIESFFNMLFNWSSNERLYKLKYRMHNAHVLQTVPKNDLLVHQSADGWLPLCNYLEKDVPDIPYPHQNKNASLFVEDVQESRVITTIIKEIKISCACLVCLVGVFIGFYFYCMYA